VAIVTHFVTQPFTSCSRAVSCSSARERRYSCC